MLKEEKNWLNSPLSLKGTPRSAIRQGIPGTHREINIIRTAALAGILDEDIHSVALAANTIITADVGDGDGPSAVRTFIFTLHPSVAQSGDNGVITVIDTAGACNAILRVDSALAGVSVLFGSVSVNDRIG
jgi:hypothetical protein